MTLEKALNLSPELRREYDSNEDVRSLFESALKIEGSVRNIQTHAAGVIISKDPLDNTVSWVERAAALNVKAILLEEYEGNMLYRRWDPYTLFNIPVVQVKARQNLTATLFPLTPSVLDP